MSETGSSLIVCDAHVHVYPFHDRTQAFAALARGLAGLADSARRQAESGSNPVMNVACLIETGAVGLFTELTTPAGAAGVPDMDVAPCSESGSVRVTFPDGDECALIAGRQLVTEERLEFLALGVEGEIPSGVSAERLVRELRDRALLVLNWAPGKWFGSRGAVVARLLAEFEPHDFVLCDTALRPVGWGEPSLMRAARARGYKVIAGSDPLPLPGEEWRVGTYGFWAEGDWDAACPARSLADVLLRSDSVPHRVGARGSLPSVFLRLLRHRVRGDTV